MRRALGFVLAALALGPPGAAQPAGPRLHRNIPGDLELGELPPGVVTAPQSAEDFRRLASGTGWDDRGAAAAAGDVIRPQGTWETVARTMDDQTRSPPGTTLRYREVFTPSVAPFKRTHAFDAVDDLGRLVVRDPSARPLRVGQIPAAWSREPIARFTGDVMIELAANAPTVVPTVAGEFAVESFRTEPEVPLAFAVDSAGNLTARAPEARTLRLVYVLAAPQHAFAAPAERLPVVPPGGTSFHGLAPAPAVPPFLAASVDAVLARVGVRRSEAFPRVLGALVGYFRGFRDDTLDGPTDGALYRRLALGGVGACRHRAYAFVLTLHALGVPARYVGNEAHAWAEVALPGVGWSRIDLGGWDVNFQDDSAARERFVPDHSDPFQRPPGYGNGYSTRAAAGDGHAPRARHGDDATPPPAAPAHGPAEASAASPGAPSGGPAAATVAGASGSGTGPRARTGSPGGASTLAPSATGSEARSEAAGERPADDPPAEERHNTVLRLLSVRASDGAGGRGVVRGTLVTCEGEARDETGAPVPDLPVALEILRDRRVLTLLRDGRRDTALGTTVTDANGLFRARVLLPLELEAGTYSLRALTPGDARHRGASVE